MTPGPDDRPAPPSDWVARWLPLLVPPGSRPRVLDLACGRGRHALALAAAGAQVTAVDRDAQALHQLARHAREAGLSASVHPRQAELEAPDAPWPLAGEAFDAVVVTNYLWRPRQALVRALVAPGGLLLHETFAQGQETVGRPTNPDFLLRPGELLEGLRDGWRVLAYEDLRLPHPDRFVQRVLARRSARRQPPMAGSTTGEG